MPLTALALAAALTCGSSCSNGVARSDTDNTKAEASAEVTLPQADADTLYSLVAAQVAFGPRVPASSAHARCHDWIAERLADSGAAVEFQDTVVIDAIGRTTPVRNIIGRFNSAAPQQVLLLAHYDTRPTADADPDPANHSRPIDGANDGGSGVAVLLEIARLAKSLPSDIGLQLLFVDAEDSGTHDNDDTWAIGAQVWSARQMKNPQRIDYGILLDMVGGRDAVFHREYFSERYASQVNQRISRAARRLGVTERFRPEVAGGINDDHVHVLAAGIPCIDIIECAHPATMSFNPTWHTMADNLDNIDPSTLKIVTDVVINAIY